MGKGVRKLILAIVGLIVLAGGFGAITADAHSGHLSYALNGYRLKPYTQGVSTSLPMSVGLSCSGASCSSALPDWQTVVPLVLSSWDSTATSIGPVSYVSPSTTNKVRVAIEFYGCAPNPWGSGTYCVDSSPFPGIGKVFFFNSNGSQCAAPSGSWSDCDKALIVIRWGSEAASCNSLSSTDPDGSGSQMSPRTECWWDKQAIAAHEFGHVVGLGHVIDNNYCGDATHYQSIMDYDCIGQPYRVNNGPRNWDICMVNHVYTRGPFDNPWAGCGQP